MSEYTLPETLYVDQWQVPRGTVVKLKTCRDFGIVAIPARTKDVRGFEIPRQLFKW